MKSLKEATEKEYFDSFVKKDAVLTIVGNYPYTCEWRLRGSREIIAKSIDFKNEDMSPDSELIITKYFIKA